MLKLDDKGKTKVAYADTHTGGALSMNAKGALFMVQRGLRANVTQLKPQRKLLANTYNGEPLDCIGGVINDLTADSKGGVYFTMGGVYHANAAGVVTKYGEGITPNGIVLSADEKTLYVTNGSRDGRVRRAGRRFVDQSTRVREADGRRRRRQHDRCGRAGVRDHPGGRRSARAPTARTSA